MRSVLFLLLVSSVLCLAQGSDQIQTGGSSFSSAGSPTLSQPETATQPLLSTSAATKIPSLPSNFVASAAVIVPVQPLPTKAQKSERSAWPPIKRQWVVLTALQHGSATFDAWSTRQSLASGNGYERNPLLKPFANSAAIYPAIQLAPLGADWISWRMARSSKPFMRKMWWLPQSVATAGFIWSGVRNLHVANMR